MSLAELFEFQAEKGETEKKEVKARGRPIGEKTRLLITVTVNALMILTAVLAYFFFAPTYGATITILGVIAVWAVVFYFLRSKNIIDELIENVVIVAVVGVLVVATLLSWNTMETPYREIMLAGSIIIVAVSLRDIQKFYREYKALKMSAIDSKNFRFFRRVNRL